MDRRLVEDVFERGKGTWLILLVAGVLLVAVGTRRFNPALGLMALVALSLFCSFRLLDPPGGVSVYRMLPVRHPEIARMSWFECILFPALSLALGAAVGTALFVPGWLKYGQGRWDTILLIATIWVLILATMYLFIGVAGLFRNLGRGYVSTLVSLTSIILCMGSPYLFVVWILQPFGRVILVPVALALAAVAYRLTPLLIPETATSRAEARAVRAQRAAPAAPRRLRWPERLESHPLGDAFGSGVLIAVTIAVLIPAFDFLWRSVLKRDEGGFMIMMFLLIGFNPLSEILATWRTALLGFAAMPISRRRIILVFVAMPIVYILPVIVAMAPLVWAKWQFATFQDYIWASVIATVGAVGSLSTICTYMAFRGGWFRLLASFASILLFVAAITQPPGQSPNVLRGMVSVMAIFAYYVTSTWMIFVERADRFRGGLALPAREEA